MAATQQKKYSALRYWRFIFTPLLLITVIIGLFMLFTSSDTQVNDFSSVVKKTNSLLSNTASVMNASAPIKNA